MSVQRMPEVLAYPRYYVYAMLCQDGDGPGYIKFGHSGRINERLTSLRMVCPIPARLFAVAEVESYKSALRLERALHRHFRRRRVTGEWFRFDFYSPEDKKVFNDGCRKVFALNYSKDKWWSQINIAELDRVEKERRRRFMRDKKRSHKLMHQQAKIAMQKRAWKELNSYGRSAG